MISIDREAPTTQEAQVLLTASEALSAALYPPESRHIVSGDALAGANARFFMARSDGRAVGCGALVIAEGYGEIKRMFVDPSARGQGVGRTLLYAIEACAQREGLPVLRLETGIHNHQAVALYTRNGYERRGSFGPYGPDPLSIFMEKRLDPKS
jgi:putative acetyltransferase